MKLYKIFLISAISFLLSTSSVFSQVEKSKGEFIERTPSFFDEMTKEADRFANENFGSVKSEQKIFKVDLSGYDLPKRLDEFKYYWFNEPVSQGLTGTCWSFSATSFYESEIYRIHNRKVKLSEMWTAYWEYIEKATGFVKTRGESYFAEGSESNAIKRIWLKYGIVPESAYTGLLPGQPAHDHRKMIEEMTKYLETVKRDNLWNEDNVIGTIKSILNRYMGEPPATFTYEGKEYSAKEFFEKVVDLKMDDYVELMSLIGQPFYKQVEYTVADNWWHNKDYYNVPLSDFISAIKNAIRNGYTMVIGGDVSEPGYDSRYKAAIIPTFEIPSDYIDDYARELRFENGSTGDDHGIHLVGYENKNGKDWFLIKDSGSGSRNIEPKGFYFYSEDYVKLKMLGITVHKDAIKDILAKF
jgi:bleomycin hydrolase